MAQLQPKVSVIIPVYNVEQYIEKCVRSLFAQTLDSIEYIFVDDCTPDDSIGVMEKVLIEFPNRKTQVKVIRHKPNKGVARSRQDGVEAATGEYIIHCDPDDWVELDMYELLYNKAKETEADLVICNYYSVKGEIVNYFDQIPLDFTSISLLEGISGRYSNFIHGSTWNKLLKADCYRYAVFPSDIALCEDVYFWFQILQHDLKIEYLNHYLYYYRINENGLVNSNTELDYKRNINLYNRVGALISTNNTRRYNKCCKSFICQLIYNRFFLKSAISNKEFSQLFRSPNLEPFSNRRLGLWPNIFLLMSKYGFKYQAMNLFEKLQKLSNRLKNFRCNKKQRIQI